MCMSFQQFLLLSFFGSSSIILLERERERERESCSGSRSEEVEKKLMQLIDGGGGVLESGRLSRSLRMPRTLFQNAVKITYA